MTASTFTEGLLSSMAPWVAQSPDYAGYLTAFGAMFDPVYALVSDQGSPDDPANYTAGWSTLLNVETCPTQYLPWLGMFVGVYVAPGTADATARALISAKAGFGRGTPAAIVATAQQFLSGTQSCVLQERTAADGSEDAYHFVLVVRPEQVLSVNGLIAAVNLVKPAGVQWTLVQADAPLLDQYTRLLSNVTVDLNAATIADVT